MTNTLEVDKEHVETPEPDQPADREPTNPMNRVGPGPDIRDSDPTKRS